MISDPFQAEDLDELLAIETACFVHPWTRGSFLAESGKTPPSLYVARENSRAPVLGYICFWLVADEIQILNLAVHPAYRRQGVARHLMHFLLHHAHEKKALSIFLEVRVSNRAAQTLYRSFGFKVIHRRPGYYGPEGEDALVMARSA